MSIDGISKRNTIVIKSIGQFSKSIFRVVRSIFRGIKRKEVIIKLY